MDCESNRWSDERLDDFKETVFRRFAQTEGHLQERFDSIRRDADKNEERTKERLDQANKFRQQMIDDRGQFLPRELFDNATAEWTIWRNEVNQKLWMTQGQSTGSRTSWGILYAIVIAATALIIAAVAIANALSAQ